MKLKDFPVVSNEVTFSTSKGKQQPLPVIDIEADEPNLNRKSNLNKKHSEIQDIGRSYQIVDEIFQLQHILQILVQITYTHYQICKELKKVKTRDFCCNFVYCTQYFNFFILFRQQNRDNLNAMKSATASSHLFMLHHLPLMIFIPHCP